MLSVVQSFNEKLKFFRNEETFKSLYSNNVQFETSVWDLKMVFGEIDQSKGQDAVVQHSGVTVGWAEAKIFGYFLLVNLVLHQAREGQIHIPSSVLPPRPDPTSDTLDGEGKKIVEYAAWLHDEFFTNIHSNPPSNAKE
jgi:hypothetical protein